MTRTSCACIRAARAWWATTPCAPRWEQLFSGDNKLSFRLDEVVVLETVGLAMQSAIEHVATADGTARGAAVATNVFMRTPSGWRMVCHHASPIATVAMPAPSGPLH